MAFQNTQFANLSSSILLPPVFFFLSSSVNKDGKNCGIFYLNRKKINFFCREEAEM